MSTSIVDTPWEFACKWYTVDEIHAAITRERRFHQTGDLKPVPEDIYSREFAEWLTEQYRLAMRKGAELATSEMKNRPCVHDLAKQHAENLTTDY